MFFLYYYIYNIQSKKIKQRQEAERFRPLLKLFVFIQKIQNFFKIPVGIDIELLIRYKEG